MAPNEDEGADINMLDTVQERRRAGLVSLLIGVGVLILSVVLSRSTGNWLWLLDASPIILVAAAMGLILLKSPPADHGSI
jgi:hypothetical protein